MKWGTFARYIYSLGPLDSFWIGQENLWLDYKAAPEQNKWSGIRMNVPGNKSVNVTLETDLLYLLYRFNINNQPYNTY